MGDLITVYKLKREKLIRSCQEDFWIFCKTLHKYKEDWYHLKLFANTLQDFFENKLLDESGNICRKLMVNMPPRHYKTRTMILFSAWVFGRDSEQAIISTSYSDDLATEFSRYTRDEISRTKIDDLDIVYSDIFPNTKLKHGDASLKKWSLEGRHFSYLGAGFGASITGKGCSLAIIDDQVKSYEDANNEASLDKKWEWYLGTFKSRMEEGSKQIIIMTRWTDKDICGRLLNDPVESPKWKVIKMEAFKDEKMLCPEMLSYESYKELQRTLPDDVFMANYHQEPIEKKGLLYQKYQEYDRLPEKDGKQLQDRRICYVDTADEGNDYLVSVCGVEYQKMCFVTDIVCSKEPQEKTEDMVVNMIISNSIQDIIIESNNGGRAFARNVERKLKEKKYYSGIVKWFHQSTNKLSRILSNASNVENRIFYPVGWNYRFVEYHKFIKSFMRSKANVHDDCPDTITGIVEMMDNKHILSSSGVSASMLGL